MLQRTASSWSLDHFVDTRAYERCQELTAIMACSPRTAILALYLSVMLALSNSCSLAAFSSLPPCFVCSHWPSEVV